MYAGSHQKSKSVDLVQDLARRVRYSRNSAGMYLVECRNQPSEDRRGSHGNVVCSKNELDLRLQRGQPAN